MVGSIGRIDQSHLRTGRLADDEWGRLTEAVDKMSSASLFIDESPGLTAAEVRARAHAASRASSVAPWA
jgi:replicative DNA helicase